MMLWPLFGSLNQLMAALALGVVSVYLHTKKISVLYTALPMLFVLVVTLWAMVENGMLFFREGDLLLFGISVLIIILTAWLTLSSLLALVKK